MKESILNVLMHLFQDSFASEDVKAFGEIDLLSKLQGEGYSAQEIQQAIKWLESFSESKRTHPRMRLYSSFRIFSFEEAQKLSVECRNYLIQLGNMGLLSNNLRERIIDRIMSLDIQVVTLKQVQWISCMVLVNQERDLPPESMRLLVEKVLFSNSTKH